MIDKKISRVAAGRRATWPGVALSLIACAIAVLPAATRRPLGFEARAAEVDAIGAPAPVGFADIIERVKPAVVGVRVKVEDGGSPDDAQQKTPPILLSANSALRHPTNRPPIPASRSDPGFSSPATAMS